jgi:S1-C subfamily serine protease
MRITRIREGRPATDTGLEVGDVILAVNGAATDSAAALRQAVVRASVREKNTFAVRREGKLVEIAVKFPD